jgi:hypothetical protein
VAECCTWKQRPAGFVQAAADLISICLVCFGAGFCTVTFSTPLGLGRNVLDLDAGGKFDRPRERAVAALDQMIILVLLFALVLLLATDGQEVVGHVELDVLLLQAW